jgi:hypothetical protein
MLRAVVAAIFKVVLIFKSLSKVILISDQIPNLQFRIYNYFSFISISIENFYLVEKHSKKNVAKKIPRFEVQD